MEENNEEQCYCKSFDEKLNYYSELFKIFNVIASSNFKDARKCGEGEYTSILSCKKCKSYYIFNSYSGFYSDDDKVSARKYIPKTDDDGLRRILEKDKGVVSQKSIDERSQLLEKLRKIELNSIHYDISEN
jgi:hypothetical protein